MTRAVAPLAHWIVTDLHANTMQQRAGTCTAQTTTWWLEPCWPSASSMPACRYVWLGSPLPCEPMLSTCAAFLRCRSPRALCGLCPHLPFLLFLPPERERPRLCPDLRLREPHRRDRQVGSCLSIMSCPSAHGASVADRSACTPSTKKTCPLRNLNAPPVPTEPGMWAHPVPEVVTHFLGLQLNLSHFPTWSQVRRHPGPGPGLCRHPEGGGVGAAHPPGGRLR